MSLASAFLGWSLLASEALLAWRRRSARGPANRETDRGSLALLWRVIGCAVAAGVTLSALGIGPRLPDGVPWAAVSVGVFVAGTVLRWWAIWHLGRFFTVDVAVSAGHRVVDDGPYRFVRHPSYTGLLLQFAGLGLALGHMLGFVVLVVPILLALLHRIHIEEQALRAALGEPYATYCQRTKRLVPLLY